MNLDLSWLPRVNASLNAVAALLLVVGYVLIKRKKIHAHRNCMIAALIVSALFLASYLTHYGWRASTQGTAHTRYNGHGLIRTAYYVMLISHIILAMIVPPVAIWLVRLALKARYQTHRRVARIAWPIWMYVSITGVLIYLMLYHWNPPG